MLGANVPARDLVQAVDCFTADLLGLSVSQTTQLPAVRTAIEAVRLSGIEEQIEGLVAADHTLGVFGKRVKPDHVLGSGDRVEIYRPLKADPKIVRREMAALGKTMGNKKQKE